MVDGSKIVDVVNDEAHTHNKTWCTVLHSHLTLRLRLGGILCQQLTLRENVSKASKWNFSEHNV